VREKKLENRNNLLLLLYFVFHPHILEKTRLLKAVMGWVSVFKEARTHQIFANKKAAHLKRRRARKAYRASRCA